MNLILILINTTATIISSYFFKLSKFCTYPNKDYNHNHINYIQRYMLAWVFAFLFYYFFLYFFLLFFPNIDLWLTCYWRGKLGIPPLIERALAVDPAFFLGFHVRLEWTLELGHSFRVILIFVCLNPSGVLSYKGGRLQIHDLFHSHVRQI